MPSFISRAGKPMIKAGIIGGAGYTAGELISLLLNHPQAEVHSAVSNSHAGKPLITAHPVLHGETELSFDSTLKYGCDVVFLCSGHGKSAAYLESAALPDHIKIIDLSNEYRLNDGSHSFVYGLPELNKKQIKAAFRIANPGCFATCIQLCLLPAAKAGLLKQDVHISALTGSTGAGQKPVATTHYSWRSNNASVYKALSHQHLGEIGQSVKQLHPGYEGNLHFIPYRGAFTRGILASCYTAYSGTLKQATELYEACYASHPFVHISAEAVDVKQVVNTNKALLHLQVTGGQLLVTGVIDNLIKGASGQAVQNMNLMCGLEETAGLQLKGSSY